MSGRCIGIVSAVPDEIAGLVRRWESLSVQDGVHAWCTERGGLTLVAVCGGMGSSAATRAFARLLVLCKPVKVYSVGWAGSLSDSLKAGSICTPSTVLDSRTGERYLVTVVDVVAQVAITTERVADREAKRRFANAYDGAALVEMEAATVARLAQAHGIEFGCVKAISDEYDEMLPDLNAYIDERGRFHVVRFALWAAVRPWMWSALIRFGRNARLAAANLCTALEKEFETEAGL